jgi:hypothetical protein
MEADENYASREFARAITSQYRRLLFKLLYNCQVFVRSDVPRKYYEIWIRQFLDFVKSYLEDDDIENRLNAFAYTANQEIKSAVEHVISFLKYQKSRVANGDITAAATLRNYVKDIKHFVMIALL